MTSTSANLTLATTFTPPPECTASPTGFTDRMGVLFVNQIYTDFTASSLFTKCYPSQLVSAAAFVSDDRKLLEEIVCPLGWETSDLNSTYRICCPPNFTLGNASPRPGRTRPGMYAICTSTIASGRQLTVTRFDPSAVSTTLATADLLVYGQVFDGYIKADVTAPVAGPQTATKATSSPSRTSGAASSSTIPTMLIVIIGALYHAIANTL